MSEPLTKKDLETILDEKFDQQAQLINSAFQGQTDHFDQRFEQINDRLDGIDGRLQTVETKLDRALYTEVVYLEARLRRVEEKVGIKPPAAKPATS